MDIGPGRIYLGFKLRVGEWSFKFGMQCLCRWFLEFQSRVRSCLLDAPPPLRTACPQLAELPLHLCVDLRVEFHALVHEVVQDIGRLVHR